MSKLKTASRCLLLALVLGSGAIARAEGQGIGEATLNGGFARGIGPDAQPSSVFLGGSFALVRGWFSLGPEVQYAQGGGRTLIEWGGVSRFRLSGGRVRPFLVAGLGSYNWKRTSFVTASVLGASFGAGVVLGDPRRHIALQGEMRFHDNLQNIGTPGSLQLFSVSVGARFQW
ncbi:MAG: hypothetical protein ABI836_09330 [Gemmatimonadota bacterium]